QYAIDITDLAQSHSVATGSFADKDVTSVGTGRLTIKVGSVTKNIDITSSNSTLSGIANEINSSKIGVSASVVDTGSGFRLVMSSEKSGAANAIEISVLDDDANSLDTSGLSQLAFNASAMNLTETVEAKDATFTVNGVSVSRSTNTVSDVIEGVTLNLTAKTSGSPVTLKVAQDTAGVADRVEEFVNKFNEFQALVAEMTKFDPASKEGGVFLGDAAVRTINNQLKSNLSQLIPGLESASVRTLSEAGITTVAQTGQLQFDRQKFIEKLESSPDDMVALFAEQGRTSDNQVEFLTSSINTKAGTYAVNVSQLATQGEFTGSVGLSDPVVIDADNRNFTLRVNNQTSVAITLTDGSYTPEALVQEIQLQLNGNNALKAAERSVSVELDASNQLVFKTGDFGSDAKIDVTAVGANSAATLGLAVAEGTAGLDVVGTINGKAATGKGQVLTAASGDDSAGISI
ncbi:MAG: flagellar filament capping protein FliD, partial [Gammaproteobacteria bacterium]|nr:flagellar filament capping protein FliD [Gammaproteobacteria bacterium]